MDLLCQQTHITLNARIFVAYALPTGNLNPEPIPLQKPLHSIPMIPLNNDHPVLNRSSSPTVLFQILCKGLQGLIIEVESKHGCHGLALPTFCFTSDTDDAVGFELRLGLWPFLFAGATGDRLLALGADAACLG